METNSNEKYLFKRGWKGNGSGLALFLIIFGSIFLLFNLGIIPKEYKSIVISWKMILIIIGLWMLIKRQYISGLVLIGVGVFFLYPALCEVFPEYFGRVDIDIKTYWPVILIVIGILLIKGHFHPLKPRDRTYVHHDGRSRDINSGDYIEKNMVFGSSEQIILSQDFQGGELNTVFGELIIDLRKAKPANGVANMEINTVFGSLIIYVPSDWSVQIKSSTMLGSFQDKRYSIDNNPTTESTPLLIIEGNSIFGSGEIRN
ncbi:MAG: cell wall-active antibiotics response protein [Prevotella sp.]|jgi:predicted membrane protein|nr:cell wall-active antibiotics response protein [Prevotella sp.]